MDERNENELSQGELEHLEAELLPKREALSVIGPLPATPTDAATDLPKIAGAAITTSPVSD